ncbi:MAG: diaminopimelate epimerase, partial [Prevotella sp.]|nr:diaminopimelate epimerase [Prevotella sp.]
FVSMGNPHYVIFTNTIDQVAELGPVLERHQAFPQRCNIEFARVEPDGKIRTRVWERGSGITEACGTGACATAVAAALTGRAGRVSRIVMDGGTLSIEWSEADNHVYMTGPAEFVFDGEITDPPQPSL